jgi:hypothetical protein
MANVLLLIKIGVGALSSIFFIVDRVLMHDVAMPNKATKDTIFFMIVYYFGLFVMLCTRNFRCKFKEQI